MRKEKTFPGSVCVNEVAGNSFQRDDTFFYNFFIQVGFLQLKKKTKKKTGNNINIIISLNLQWIFKNCFKMSKPGKVMQSNKINVKNRGHF